MNLQMTITQSPDRMDSLAWLPRVAVAANQTVIEGEMSRFVIFIHFIARLFTKKN